MVTHYLAKVSPIPIGASNDNVRAWLTLQGIIGKSVKALGSSAWMISTVEKPKRSFLIWGHNSVLMVPIKPWGDKTKLTVVAGQSRQKHVADLSHDFDEDPMQLSDQRAVWAPSS